MGVELTADINGRRVRRVVEPGMTAVEFLREECGLTGTKSSCEQQICGACTILVDGRPTSACCTLVHDLDGCSVVTIEGIAQGEDLHPVQRAFLAERGFQCGFCTPGMIMTTVALLGERPRPTRDEIADYFDANLCRCTGYGAIIRAVELAAKAGEQEP